MSFIRELLFPVLRKSFYGMLLHSQRWSVHKNTQADSFRCPPQSVEKVQMRLISCKSLAEFRRRQTTEGREICFFRRHVRRKKHCSARKRASKASATQRAATLRARACTCERACRLCRQAQADSFRYPPVCLTFQNRKVAPGNLQVRCLS